MEEYSDSEQAQYQMQAEAYYEQTLEATIANREEEVEHARNLLAEANEALRLSCPEAPVIQKIGDFLFPPGQDRAQGPTDGR